MDGCTMADANRLEQVQLNAARIVSWLPVFLLPCVLFIMKLVGKLWLRDAEGEN